MADASRSPQVLWPNVEHYLGKRQPVPFRLRQSPRVEYVITDDSSIALYLELGPRQRLPRSPLPLIQIDEISHQGLRMARLRITQSHLLRDFHDLLNAVADRAISHGRTPEQAFLETVRAWSALLDRPRALGTEVRIGLLGELAVLNSAAAVTGWQKAIESWKGPVGEEHDFGLPGFDVEVKTTGSETRHHTIHGTGQLTPNPDRHLWLVSLQLTRGGSNGRTFSACADAIRAQLTEHAPSCVDIFDLQLAAAGWNPELPDDERWSLRNDPLVLAADSSLPRIDDSVLAALLNQLRSLIDQVQYRIDVSALPSAPEPPAALRDIRLP